MTDHAPPTDDRRLPRPSIAERARRRAELDAGSRDRYDSLLRHLRAGQEIAIQPRGGWRDRLEVLDWHPIAGRLLLTSEACGGHVDNRMFLAYILRRYPVEALGESTPIPVAALLAPTPAGNTVAEEAAAQFYGGDLETFFNDYLDLTLRLHVLLWLRYGVALESNQQNSVVVLSREAPRLRLLLKDNDAGRIHLDHLARRWPDLAAHVAGLRDRRIVVADSLPLAQMFTTITLQLNVAVLVERFASVLGQPPETLYATVRQRIETLLAELAADGEDVTLARRVLLEDERLYIKYLLIAATLTEKTETGATDVNKFYGRSAPNFLVRCN